MISGYIDAHRATPFLAGPMQAIALLRRGDAIKSLVIQTTADHSCVTQYRPAFIDRSTAHSNDKNGLFRYAKAFSSTRGMIKRLVITAGSVFDGLAQIELSAPEYAVVDMRLDDGCGLDLISALKQQRPDARAIILTGYGNIATAVRAVKLGASDYLTKPMDVDDVVSALLASNGGKAEPPQHPMSAARVRWEHIQNVHEACGRNVSETARRLNMHRRTLQRILTRHPTSEFLVREPE